ncbi:hypothetical protein FA13DRAFT_718805 [Coprinellus micaceus]|uniref:Uncharacterized protein n=1 Tax=Coprinellus micaceus TaxID=71717 RepID=A0A4Y7TWP2_COPMI|nr:hypothetical protein FA13DRAFT_718805 [Coprinellus micaceus]
MYLVSVLRSWARQGGGRSVKKAHYLSRIERLIIDGTSSHMYTTCQHPFIEEGTVSFVYQQLSKRVPHRCVHGIGMAIQYESDHRGFGRYFAWSR